MRRNLAAASPFRQALIGLRAGGRVRLRTLVAIRWFGIIGQLAALLFVEFSLGYRLPLVPCLLAVAALAAVNIWASYGARGSRRLSDRAAALSLAFDLLQLAALLALTGGLHNPFAILILAPVTVSATVLSRQSTALLGLLAIAAVAVLALWHLPLPWPNDRFSLEPMFIAGLAIALGLSTLFVAAYVFSVSEEARRMSDALSATERALDRERQVSALGALAAAAAHELGTPLGTIAVVAKELARELPAGSPHADDVALLQSQSQRCREILAGLAARPEVDGGAPFERLSLTTLIETAALPYRRAEIALHIDEAAEPGEPPPVARRPEILHALGTLIQNAIEFARSEVAVTIDWDERQVTVSIADDGPGFPADLLGRLGEPYLSGGEQDRGGEHMGLGVFIAATLIQRTGGRVEFTNRDPLGAEATVIWDRASLAVGA